MCCQCVLLCVTVCYEALFCQGTQRRLPRALIIGVRKCGTRALIEMLNLHPNIRKRDAEVHFFDDDDRYNNGIDWYRKKMPYSFDDQVRPYIVAVLCFDEMKVVQFRLFFEMYNF